MIPQRYIAVIAAILCFSPTSGAKDRLGPCHTHSRQMTLVKNCYTGDMMKPVDGGAQFFDSAPVNKNGASYCYNSLVLVEQKPGEALVRINVLKDSRDGQVLAYVAPEEVKKIKRDAPLLSLKGLKGECYSPTGDREVCAGGILKAIGLQDVNVPMVVAVGKANSGRYTVSHLVYDSKELDGHKAKELEPAAQQDLAKVTDKVLQEIRKKLVSAARQKMGSLHSPAMTPKKLAENSEQFRYCSLALEGFLKEKRLPDPMSPDEKMTMAKLTSYMNGETAPQASPTRLPASTSSKRR
jgi:hypothetical protein